MSRFAPLYPIAVTGLIGFAVVAANVAAPNIASAQSRERVDVTRPHIEDVSPQSHDLVARVPDLSLADRRAALQSLHFALTEVADGSSYVWHRRNGKLSGVVRPTSSFKDANGAICRHLVVIMKSPADARQTEAIACRGRDGIWAFEG